MIETTFERAYEIIGKLVDDFKQGQKHYLSKDYQEAEARKDFIDKFFIALGWDVHHDEQKNPFEQEVKVEKGVDVSGAQKKADYSFTLAPYFNEPKFFVEAKKPSQDLANPDYYFQVARYGWHQNTPLCVLTNFNEFHVIDSRFSPDISIILKKKWKSYHYTDYLNKEKFSEIYYLFSREAVLDNSIGKRVEELPTPRGKSVQKALFPYEVHKTIDDDFLNDIELKREVLAKAFKKNDNSLTSEELTEATQRTIDRLVFIRFLEDKQIEQEHYVDKFGENGKAWDQFIALCRKLDAKYNGVVFKKNFIDADNFKGPVDSEFHSITQDLCHLNSRFLFNQIPIHILGSIYERFLGKIIHATPKQVRLEEKEEIRKQGGVYYTPKYVVDYIVNNTIVKQIEGKTPDQIAKLRFADIACGSGSFLISVFDALLIEHSKYYQLNPDRAKKDGCHFKDGIWVLSIKQKQKILVNNIYGIDIDNQAVEVTQLSLSLKMLEDETTATANDMQVLFHVKILPDMSKNIVCGNSIIESDVVAQDLFGETDIDTNEINPLDLSIPFNKILKDGGFDAIVGNPPWVDIKELPPAHVKYYFKKYKSVENRMNLYAVFVERCLSILSKNGLFGYIIPNSILYQSSYTKLRNLILSNYSVNDIVRLPDDVFKNVKAETVILVIQGKKVKNNKCHVMIYNNDDKINIISNENVPVKKSVNDDGWKNSELSTFDIFSSKEINDLLKKIEKDSVELVSLCDFTLGLTPYDAYKGHTKKQIEQRVFHSTTKKDATFKKLLAGGDVKRFYVEWGGEEYISYGDWLGAPREKRFFTGERILIRQIVSGKPLRIYAGWTNEELYNQQSIFNLLRKSNCELDLKYILAIMNSKLMNMYHAYKFLDLSKRLFQKILIQNCKKFPIRVLDLKNKEQKKTHDKIIELVNQIMEVQAKLDVAKTDKDKSNLQNRYNSLDKQIDVMICNVYQMDGNDVDLIEV